MGLACEIDNYSIDFAYCQLYVCSGDKIIAMTFPKILGEKHSNEKDCGTYKNFIVRNGEACRNE